MVLVLVFARRVLIVELVVDVGLLVYTMVSYLSGILVYNLSAFVLSTF